MGNLLLKSLANFALAAFYAPPELRLLFDFLPMLRLVRCCVFCIVDHENERPDERYLRTVPTQGGEKGAPLALALARPALARPH